MHSKQDSRCSLSLAAAWSTFASVLYLAASIFLALSPVLTVTMSFACVFGWVALSVAGLRSMCGLTPARGLGLVTLSLLLFCGLAMLAGETTDFSYDGPWFQQLGILRLLPAEALAHLPSTVDNETAALLSSYPSGGWKAAAVVTQLWQNVQASKALVWAQGLSCFFLLLALLRGPIASRKTTSLLAALVVLNPVVVAQLLTLYNDGWLYLCGLNLALLLAVRHRELVRLPRGTLTMQKLFLLNLAPNAVLLSVLLMLGEIAATRVGRLKAILKNCAILVFSALVLGQPSLTKLQRFELWPRDGLAGHPQRPVSLRPHEPLGNLARSLFSTTANFETTSQSTGAPHQLKLPGQISAAEIWQHSEVDVRLGGLGPWFSLALVLAFLLLLFLPPRAWGFPLIVLLSALLFDESWWMRNVPQLWLVPLFVAFTASKLAKRRWPARLLLAIVALNTLFVGLGVFKGYFERSAGFRTALAEMQSFVGPYSINFGRFPSFAHDLRRRGLAFTSVSPEACHDPVPVFGVVQFCRGLHHLRVSDVRTGTDGVPYILKTLADLQDTPWSLHSLSRERLLYNSRQTGEIWEFDLRTRRRRLRHKIEGSYVAGGSGTLGMELDPAFEKNDTLYVYYSYLREQKMLNRVVRLNLKTKKEVTLVEGIPGSLAHNGGRLKVSQGHMFITTGDGEELQPLPQYPQDVGSSAGKILRIKLDGRVPKDNPFYPSMVYSYGHRNPQGLVIFDGMVWSTEHGPETQDELNLIRAGGNYGWPHCLGRETCGQKGRYIPAVAEFDRAATVAISDLLIYQGAAFPQWRNKALITSLKEGKLFVYDLTTGKRDVILNLKGFSRLRDITTDAQGLIYLCADEGRIFRLSPLP
jgi:glucose/arabinose dehydrogenase